MELTPPLAVLRLYPDHDYSLHGAFLSRMQRDPLRPFMVYAGRTWSWDAFHDALLRTARVLMARGIRPGDRVALMARNYPGHPLLLFALSRLGAIMVPVNPEFGVTEASYVLHHAGVAAVVCSTETLAVARAASSGIDTQPWFMLLDGEADGVPALDALIAAAPDAALPPNADADPQGGEAGAARRRGTQAARGGSGANHRAVSEEGCTRYAAPAIPQRELRPTSRRGNVMGGRL